MHQNHNSRLQAFLGITFFLALIYVIGRMGALELDRISVGQAVVSCSVAVGYLLIAAVTYKLIGKEE